MFRRKGIYCLIESVQKRRIYCSVDYVQERWNILFSRICSKEKEYIVQQNMFRREKTKSVEKRSNILFNKICSGERNVNAFVTFVARLAQIFFRIFQSLFFNNS